MNTEGEANNLDDLSTPDGAGEDESWPERWLLPGETVLWRGQRALVRRSAGDLGYAAYAALMAAFYVLYLQTHAAEKSTVFDPVIWAVFGASTLLAAISVFRTLVLAPRALRRERYALTDRRLLIGSARPQEPTRSWYREQLGPPRTTQNPDGTSDVALGGVQDHDRPRIGGRVPAPRGPVLRSITHPSLFLVLLTAPPAAPREVGPLPEVPAAVDGWSPRPGERVLWTGRAVRRPWRFATENRLQVWTTMVLPVLIGETAVTLLIGGAPTVAAVSMVAFLVGALHMSVGHLVWRRMRFARSTYVVTDQRVLCVWTFRQTVVTEADLRTLRPPLVRADGSVFFAPSSAAAAVSDGSVARGLARRLHPAAVGEPPNFIGLADAPAAAAIVDRARTAAWARASVPGWREGR